MLFSGKFYGIGEKKGNNNSLFCFGNVLKKAEQQTKRNLSGLLLLWALINSLLFLEDILSPDGKFSFNFKLYILSLYILIYVKLIYPIVYCLKEKWFFSKWMVLKSFSLLRRIVVWPFSYLLTNLGKIQVYIFLISVIGRIIIFVLWNFILSSHFRQLNKISWLLDFREKSFLYLDGSCNVTMIIQTVIGGDFQAITV